MRNGYTKGLVSYGGNRRIFRPQGDPLSSRVSDCLATPLALASSWKSKGAGRRIVKDKGSGLIKPIETHRKGPISAKNWKILMRRNSDRPACVATRQRPDGSIDALLQFSTEHGQMLGVAIACGRFLAVFHTVHLLSISHRKLVIFGGTD
jgi:hypothetical protein